MQITGVNTTLYVFELKGGRARRAHYDGEVFERTQ